MSNIYSLTVRKPLLPPNFMLSPRKWWLAVDAL